MSDILLYIIAITVVVGLAFGTCSLLTWLTFLAIDYYGVERVCVWLAFLFLLLLIPRFFVE